MLPKNRIFVLFVHFVDNLNDLITEGSSNFIIDFDKFVALLLFCAIESGAESDIIEKKVRDLFT